MFLKAKVQLQMMILLLYVVNVNVFSDLLLTRQKKEVESEVKCSRI